MKRPLKDKRVIGPLFDGSRLNRSTNCELELRIKVEDPPEAVDDVPDNIEFFYDKLGYSVNAHNDGGMTVVEFGEDEMYVSTIYFGLTDAVGDTYTDAFVRTQDGDISLTVSDSYRDVRGSIKILDSFLGQLEDEADERDIDAERQDSQELPSNEEIRDEMETLLNEIADGYSRIESYKVKWDDEGYEATFRWQNDRIPLSQATEILAEISSMPEEFGGAPRDLQQPNGKVRCS